MTLPVRVSSGIQNEEKKIYFIIEYMQKIKTKIALQNPGKIYWTTATCGQGRAETSYIIALVSLQK
jgi:hypothetical protein